MYYILNERQARMIALDYQHLIGKQLNRNLNLIIEQVEPQLMQDGSWQVYLKTYMGNKDQWWQKFGHANMTSNLFIFLSENELTTHFNPDKYELTPQDKIQ